MEARDYLSRRKPMFQKSYLDSLKSQVDKSTSFNFNETITHKRMLKRKDLAINDDAKSRNHLTSHNQVNQFIKTQSNQLCLSHTNITLTTLAGNQNSTDSCTDHQVKTVYKKRRPYQNGMSIDLKTLS